MKITRLRACVALSCLFMACGPDDAGSNNDPNSNSNVDTSNGNNTASGSPVEILPEGYESVAAGRFSPNGARLAMVATPSGDRAEEELITTDLTGSDVEVIVVGGLSYLTTMAWMPDGESLLYGGNQGIMQVGLDGSEPTLVVDAFAVESVDISPDSAFVTWTYNGGTMITTAPLSAEPTATEEHIVGPTGDMPRFGAEGQIAYVVSDGIAVSEPNGDNAQSIAAATHFFSSVAWADERTVIALTDFGLTSFDLDSGASTDVHEEFAAISLDVSPDGERFVVGVNGQKFLRVGFVDPQP